jgi:3-hydroxyisobutyrate dehydrogenase-like beta-hydroxyacid dehydrogenase
MTRRFAAYTPDRKGCWNIFARFMIIEMSTVSPETSRELHRLGSARGVSVLDVPVSGSTPAAEQGSLTLLAGGDEDSFHAAEAIFAAIGRQHFYLGPSGSGNTMKLVVNTLLGVGMQAIAEAVASVRRLDLIASALFDVLSKTAVIAPAHLGKLTKALEHDYRPEFAVGLMNKDFRLILETAAAVRAPMPTAAAAFPINNAEFADHPDYDFSAVIDRMEDLANVNSAGEMRWRTAKMSWSPGSPPELVGEPQRCLFQRDFACSVLYASRLTPIVCKESSVTASCLS